MKKLYSISILCGLIISLLANTYRSKDFYDIIFIFMVITTSYLFIKELRILLKYFISYMFNLNSGFFDKKIERPRLFVYLIFGSFSILLLYLYYYVDKRNFLDFYIISTIFVLLHITLSCVLIFTWHQDFESKFITKIQKKISRKNNNSFSLQWNSPEELNLIYKNLDEKNFVEVIDENSENLDYIIFSEIIINGKLPESPLFKLNMDNRQTKLFFDLLSHNSEGFTLDKFLKIFKNKNKKATRESIESSYSNTDILPKRHNELKDVFSNPLVKKD